MVHRMAMIVTRMSLGYSGGSMATRVFFGSWLVPAFAIMNFLADVNPLAAGAKSPEGERQWATRR